jgi:transmembrane sensor
MQARPPKTSSRDYGHLRVVPNDHTAMTDEERTPERAAADWYVLLREDPDDEGFRSGLAEWLATDRRNAVAWQGMLETAELINHAPAKRRGYSLPPAVRTQRSWMRWKTAALAAAAACVAVVIAPGLNLWLSADHVTDTAQLQTMRLDDGSTVHLGPDSAVAVDYRGDARDVRLLSGQAMFEVAPDNARPFRVHARHVTTTVLGTQFDVRMIGAATSVAVRHGKVRVENAATPSVADRVLTAGEWVRVDPDMPLIEGTLPPDEVGQWRTGHMPIRNRPIAEAIDEIRPWYGGIIILADARLGARQITGTYDFHDPVRSLGLIVAPYGGRITRITPWLVIVRAD